MIGISTSVMTSSGRWLRASSSALLPSAALSTSWPAVSSSAASASRFARWSSAMRILATRLSDRGPARLFRPGTIRCVGGDKNTASESAESYRSFGAFYPFYLSQHADRTCRRLHFLGTTFGLAGVIAAVATMNLWWLAAGLVAGHALARGGGFFFQKKKP